MKFYWNPWHGCHKYSEGCQNCYMYAQDIIYGRDSNIVQKVKTNFKYPLAKHKNGDYQIPTGSLVLTCFTSDFFIEEADAWRDDAWDIIRQRSDCHFMIFTKRIARANKYFPLDWCDGFDNVTIAVSSENQKRADERIPVLLSTPIKHRMIAICPILEKINIVQYLQTGLIESVTVGGESYSNARICNYDWVLDLHEQCVKHNVEFSFHQTGSHFLKDGTIYRIKNYKLQQNQALKAGLNYKGSTISNFPSL